MFIQRFTTDYVRWEVVLKYVMSFHLTFNQFMMWQINTNYLIY